VRYNREDSFEVWDTTEEKLLHCGIQWKKISFVVGYNGRKFVQLPETAPRISYNGGRPLLLYPTAEETNRKMLLCCIPQWQKIKYTVGATPVVRCCGKMRFLVSI
jgi:hypothetical protein